MRVHLQLGPGDVSVCAIVPRDSSSSATVERNPLVGDPFCHQQHRVQVGACTVTAILPGQALRPGLQRAGSPGFEAGVL
jgi:hypothetical protein